MGDVIATLRVTPNGIDVDLNELKDKLKKNIEPHARVHKIIEEPIAFGLKALNVVTVIAEQDGLLEKVETSIKQTDGVSEVEMIDVRRSL